MEATSNLTKREENKNTYKKLEERCLELREQVYLNNKILLIKGLQCKPETFEIDVVKNRCYYAYPPTGLQCLAEAIHGENDKERNLNVRILDLNFEFLKRTISDSSFNPQKWLNVLDEQMEEFNPSVVGTSNLFSTDTPPFIDILEHLRKDSQKRVILAGGQNATYDGKNLLRDDLCDFICRYEAENKVNFLLDTLHGFKDRNKPVSGILFKHDKEIIETEGEKDIVNLSGNLIKTYSLMQPIEEYSKVGTISPYLRMSGKDKPFATVLMNRGCHGACDFCGVPEFSGRKVRSKPTEDLLDELEYLYNERGVRHFEFLDDDLAVYKDKFAEVLEGILDRKLNEISWASNNGIIASCLDERLMQLMSETNCLGFKIGVESANEETLKKVKKPGTIPKFRKFAKMSERFPDMFIADNYILGLPNLENSEVSEPWGLIMKDYHFSKEMDLDWSCYFVFQPNVSYFGDRKEGDSNYIGEFVPSNEAKKGKLVAPRGVVEGPEIFKLPSETIPSVSQVSQAQITFNLVRNFILNKNLTHEGRIDKYQKWVTAVQDRYPYDASMNLFLGIAYAMDGKTKKSEVQYSNARKNLRNDPYWQRRFNQFGLDEVVNSPPTTSSDAEQAIRFLRDKYNTY
jgi:anaerobic magnesium-protoporphyrin IX monomethyl ester cyclase